MKLLFSHNIYTAVGRLSGGSGFGRIIAVLGVVAFVFAALAVMAFIHRRRKLDLFWGVLAALFSGAAMLLCVAAPSAGTIVADPKGNPQEVVTGFFDAFLAGDYGRAYTCLSGRSDLGLDHSPADPVSQAMQDALCRSYAYELFGGCDQDKLTAHQQIQFTYLDLPATEEVIAAATTDVLAEFVETRSRAQLYDEEGQYLPEVAREAYYTAVTRVLENPGEYTTTVGIQLELEYVDGGWFLIPSQTLLNAINGGI